VEEERIQHQRPGLNEGEARALRQPGARAIFERHELVAEELRAQAQDQRRDVGRPWGQPEPVDEKDQREEIDGGGSQAYERALSKGSHASTEERAACHAQGAEKASQGGESSTSAQGVAGDHTCRAGAILPFMATIERHYARELVSLPTSATCREAAALMKDRRIGAVAVRDGDEVVGLVAERDLALRVVGEGETATVKLGHVVRADGPAVGPQATEKECADLMRSAHVRHLLVKDGGKVTGLISMRDVIVLMLEEKEHMIRQLEGYISGH
jgi:CBS domain-containing protein